MYSWRKFRSLVGQLLPSSRFGAARSMDPELAREALAAEQAADTDGTSTKWSPPLVEWNTGTMLQAETRDLLMDAVALLAGIRNGVPVVQQERLKPAPKVTRTQFPRPVTALDEARVENAQQAAHQLLAWFFPHASNN